MMRSREGSLDDRLTVLAREKPLTEEEMNKSRTTFYENLKTVPSVVIPSEKELDHAVKLGMQPFSLVEAQILLNRRHLERQKSATNEGSDKKEKSGLLGYFSDI